MAANRVDRVEVGIEAKMLALDYIYHKLKKENVEWTRCPPLLEPKEYYLTMRRLGEQFERLYRKRFDDLATSLQLSSITTYREFLCVCQELFQGENYINDFDHEVDAKWSKIVALFAFGGMLASRCATDEEMIDQLQSITDWIYIYARNRLAFWICKQGGWSGLLEYEKRKIASKKWARFTVGLGLGLGFGLLTMGVLFAKASR